MALKLGLLDPRPGAVPLRLATYLNFRALPTPPEVFGHYQLVPAGTFGMLGNDTWGDCAPAGACHQEMIWTKEGGDPAPFDTAAALANYSAITGFDVNAGPSGDNPTDQGCDLGQLADYWLATGIVDSNGKHHKIVAVMDLNPQDLRELWLATYLFQSVGLGFDIPASALEQNKAGKPWDVVADDGGIQGGHYVPCVARPGIVITWGRPQAFTDAFYTTYNNQGIVALSEEMMIQAKSVDGFDDKLLRDDLEQIRGEHPRRTL